MRTLTEKYNGVLEGRYAKAQFLRDARLAHPQFITQFNGYDDTVSILKNKGMISEAPVKYVELHVTNDVGDTVAKFFHPTSWYDEQKHVGELRHYLGAWVKNMTPEDQKHPYTIAMSQGTNNPSSDAVEITKDDLEAGKKLRHAAMMKAREKHGMKEEVNETVYKDVADDIDKILPDSVRRGLDFELEKAGFDTVAIDFDEKTRNKYLKKAVERLVKDPNYYLNQLSGDSSRTKKHDREVEVDQKALFKGTVDPKGGKAEGNVDTFNAMKKAQLREAVKSLVVETLNEGTEKLERHLVDSDNPDLVDMFPDYTKGVKDLMSVVLDIEKAFVSHRDKVEGAFKMVGHLRAPAVAKSFVAELVDVLRKYQNIPLPDAPVAAEEIPMEEEEKQLA